MYNIYQYEKKLNSQPDLKVVKQSSAMSISRISTIEVDHQKTIKAYASTGNDFSIRTGK